MLMYNMQQRVEKIRFANEALKSLTIEENLSIVEFSDLPDYRKIFILDALDLIIALHLEVSRYRKS